MSITTIETPEKRRKYNQRARVGKRAVQIWLPQATWKRFREKLWDEETTAQKYLERVIRRFIGGKC